ncbi:DUF1351 domain-containing protein [Loigolactobacillus coryniformis]|uniref:DUF1351 domain-containing protein n=1 Tax=Loigolactobacillus coryniformis TaxID=1610 RepID=UPI001C5FE74B|nr:DUF1351 domain-containing protein [Loigolactobacillus coryniformis]MBW4803772.1 DUF1351 domain-containing protein [Loigolactobacillus coryniformis subsp. torquens]MBW4806474.1 DUF1351 domain-containing protein [Loigolactobacillus coryniformis subsp. torquens]
MANEVTAILPQFTVKYTPVPIEITNEAQLKQAITDYASKYKGLVVTEDTFAEAKSVRAEMRKVVTELDENRRKIKRGYNKPLDDFEVRINELKATVKQVITPIDTAVKELEERQRQQRLLNVQALIDEMAPNYGVTAADVEVNPEWLNKSISHKKIVDGVAGTMTAIKAERDRIATEELSVRKYAEANGQQSEGWVTQVSAGVELVEIFKRIDQAVIRQKEASEQERKAAEAAAAVEKLKQKQVGNKTVDTETGEVVDAVPELVETRLRILGTHEQLMALKQFMDDSAIEYEYLEG